MEEPRNRYILLQDCVGNIIERNMLVLGLSTKSTPTQVLKGELLEALPEAEQPKYDSTRIALAGIDRKPLRLECSMADIARLTSEDAGLLLAISSRDLRYEIYIDKKRLEFGRRIRAGSQVSVEVEGLSKKLHGAVWYIGELPPNIGTMFGVQLFVSIRLSLCRFISNSSHVFSRAEGLNSKSLSDIHACLLVLVLPICAYFWLCHQRLIFLAKGLGKSVITA